MELSFSKYHGTGNDFVIIDGMSPLFDISIFDQYTVKSICDRRFGVGADGLIILRPSPTQNFKMDYFNADGRRSTMCGNGSRCLIDFAIQNSYALNQCSFEAVDGIHKAIKTDVINVSMQDVIKVEVHDDSFIMDTGSPHYVKVVDDVDTIHLVESAHAIRYSDAYKNEGINVNFMHRTDQGIQMRTYERGVEDETYSCGTGTVACAIAASLKWDLQSPVHISTKGGPLQVEFRKEGDSFIDIKLIGPAIHVYSGTIKLPIPSFP